MRTFPARRGQTESGVRGSAASAEHKELKKPAHQEASLAGRVRGVVEVSEWGRLLEEGISKAMVESDPE